MQPWTSWQKKTRKNSQMKPITTTPCSPKCDGKASTKMPGRVNISPWQYTKTRKNFALPETNIFAPGNRPSQKEIHIPTNHWFAGANYQFQGGSLGSIFVKLAIPMLDMSVGYVHRSILAIRTSAKTSSAPLNPIPSYHGRPQNAIIACVFREDCLKSRLFQLYIILLGWSMKTR